MAKLSDRSKLALAVAQKKRLETELAKVSAKVEACLSCDQRKLEAELLRLQAKHRAERAKLAKQLNVPESALSEKQAKNVQIRALVRASEASKKAPKGRRKVGATAALPGKTSKARGSKKRAKKRAKKGSK